MYENLSDEVIPFGQFLRRLSLHAIAVAIGVCVSLAIGMVGYHAFGPMSWLDAFLNASMILIECFSAMPRWYDIVSGCSP